jgi:uncharacterized protein with PIN domain
MMTLYDYDQTRVRKVKELTEKYQTITQEVIVKLHEKTLEVKNNELDRTKEELQMAKSTNLTLSKRIEELEKERNQVSGQKPSLKPVKNMLKTHNKTAHGRSEPNSCTICGARFILGSHLKLHSAQHTISDQDVAVPKLQKQPRETIVVNPKNMTPIQEKKIQSNSKTTSEKFNNLKRPKTTKYSCTTCGLNLRNGYALKIHIATVHEKEKNFSCEFCPKKFAYGGTMKRHIETIHEGKTYPCPLCGKQLGDPSTVSQHIETIHENKKETFNCENCHKSFSTKSNLNRHCFFHHRL